MQLTPNLKFDTRLKQETQNFFGFYGLLNFFLYFSKLFWKKKIKKFKIFNKNSRIYVMLV